jgi:hypothetical protein
MAEKGLNLIVEEIRNLIAVMMITADMALTAAAVAVVETMADILVLIQNVTIMIAYVEVNKIINENFT